MGYQRGIAEALMEHFVLTKDEAWDKVKYVEATQLGDELSDTIQYLLQDGELDETLEGLENLLHQLANARMNLMAAFSGVKKRKE